MDTGASGKAGWLVPAFLFFLLFLLVAPTSLWGEMVGRLTELQGRVDLLKGGKLPAIAMKVNDEVEPGDILRTKSLSRAQITFVDNSTVTLSPESRLTIEAFDYDPAKGKRHAVIQLLHGMALTVVKKIFKVEEPDFIIKTHTAIVGVRGTEVGTGNQANSSLILNFIGATTVGNVQPEITGKVNLGNMEGTMVQSGFPPTLPFTLTDQDKQFFINKLQVPATGAGGQGGAGGGGGGTNFAAGSSGTGPGSQWGGTSGTGGTGGPDPGGGTLGSNLANVGGSSAIGGGDISSYGNTPLAGGVPYIPPTQTNFTPVNNNNTPPPPPPAPPAPLTYNFTQTFSGLTYNMTSAAPFAAANFVNSNVGSGARTGVYAGNFTTNLAITAATTQNNTFAPTSSGGFLVLSSSGTVTGALGNPLTGTMQITAKTTGGTNFNLSGPVTIQPTGNLSFTPTGTSTTGGVSGTTSGTWNQTKTP
jgi:hypothetical protein